MNSQPAGIGRVVSLRQPMRLEQPGPQCRVRRRRRLRPLAIFGDTMFPEDDEASQFDLDIHAIIELADTGQVAVLNHLGVGADLRALVGRTRSRRRTRPHRGATARLCRGHREGGRPRRPPGDITAPRSAPGRCAGERTHRLCPPDASTPSIAQESFGFVTALAASSTPEGTGWVALGGEGRVRLVEADARTSRRHPVGGRGRFLLRRAGGVRVLPLGGRQRPGRCRSRRLRLGATGRRGAGPARPGQRQSWWRPPASATTWRGGVGAWRWSWPTACPVAWVARGELHALAPGARVTTRAHRPAGAAPARHRPRGGGRRPARHGLQSRRLSAPRRVAAHPQPARPGSSDP